MIRAYYDFMNSRQRLSWSSALLKADTAEAALVELAGVLTWFERCRLVDVRLSFINTATGKEVSMSDARPLIETFIQEHQK